jgi:hypothetical protein
MTKPASDYVLEEVLEAMRKDGSLIREKARVLTEDGLERLYRRMCDNDLPHGVLLDIMKYLAEIGDLKPKTLKDPSNAGPGFSITINIPQQNSEPVTLEGSFTDVDDRKSIGCDGLDVLATSAESDDES